MQKINKKWFINQLLDALQRAGNKKTKLTPGSFALLISIAKFADKNGECYPSQVQLEELSNITVSNQHNQLKKLKAKNFISYKTKYDKEKKMKKRYYKIHLDIILNLSLDENESISVENISCSNTEQDVLSTSYQNVLSTSPSIKATNHKKQLTKKELLDSVPIDDFDTQKVIHIGVSKFDEFWAVYPRKERKKKCREIWERHSLESIGDRIVEDVLKRTSCYDRWDDKQFIPMPSSYLNGEYWNDEIVDKNLKSETSNGKSNSYIEKLKRAGDQLTRQHHERNGSGTVSPISSYLERKMDKKF